jgi:putative flavoprotein involved in K+ transport
MKWTGLLDENLHEVDDINRARRVPSPQLVGTDDRSTLDLNTLTDRGVELFGRLAGVNNGKAQFSGSLRNNCAMADLKMGRLLDTIDGWARDAGWEGSPAERFDPTQVAEAPRLSLDFTSGEIKTVVWATGFRPDYSWLDVPVFDRKGRLRHDGGVVDAPGLYTMGLNFMRRRKSSFIHGAEDDAKDLSAHLTSFLADSRKPLLMSG